MAITFVNKGTFASGNGAVTPGLPASVVAGDLMLLFVETANEAVTTPSGWTQVTNSPQSTGTAATAGGVRLTAFYRWWVTGDAAPSIADSGNHNAAIILAYQGVHATTPIDSTQGTTWASATNPNWDSPKTSVADCFHVVAVAHDNDAASTANMSGWAQTDTSSVTERHDQTIATGVGGGLVIVDGVRQLAGFTPIWTSTSATNVAMVGLVIALSPKLDTGLTNKPTVVPRRVFATGQVTSFALNDTGSVRCVFATEDKKIWRSTDNGVTWTATLGAFSQTSGHVTWVHDRFIAIGVTSNQGLAAWHSTDGSTWTAFTLPSTACDGFPVRACGFYYMVSTGSSANPRRMWRTTDFSTFTLTVNDGNANIIVGDETALVYANTGTATYRSTDGINFATGGALPASVSTVLNGAANGSGVFILPRASANYFYSADRGVSWSLGTLAGGGTESLQSEPTYRNGKFAIGAAEAGTGANGFYVSMDGVTWVNVYPGISGWVKRVYAEPDNCYSAFALYVQHWFVTGSPTTSVARAVGTLFQESGLTASIAALCSKIDSSLTTAIQFGASVAVQSSVITANLTTPINFAASIAALSSALSASLTTAVRLNAVVSAQTTITGAALATEIKAQTSISALCSVVSAGLTTAVRLNGSMAAVSTPTGALTTAIRLAAPTLGAVSTARADLFTVKRRGGNTANNGNGTANLSLVIPAATRGGDVLTAGLTIAGGSGVSISSVPSGWALLGRTDRGTVLAQAIYWKVASGSPDAVSPEAGSSPQWTFTNNKASGALDAWYDAKPDAPYFIAGQSNASGTSITAPGGTTSFQFSMAVWVFGTATNTTQSAVPGTFSQQDASTGNPATATIVSYQNQPGTGISVASQSATVGVAAENIGQLLFIQTENPLIGGVGSSVASVTGAITTSIQLAGAVAALSTGTADLTAPVSIQLAADVAAVSSVTGALTTAIQPAASAAALSSLTGALTTAILPAASVAAISTVTADLSVGAGFASSIAALSTIAGALTTAIQPAASIAALSTVTAALTTDIRLAASVEALSTATADLTSGAGIVLEAAVTDVVSTTGALTTSIALVASLTAQTNNVLASLNTGIPLVGVLAAALSTSAGTLTTSIQLASSVASLATATSDLTVQGVWEASGAAQSTATGALTTQIALTASVAALSTVTGALTTDISLAASIAAVTENSGALTTEISLTSSVAALSTITGALTTQIALASSIAAISTATATMFSAGTPTLSNPTVINKTTTTVTPRVTYSF